MENDFTKNESLKLDDGFKFNEIRKHKEALAALLNHLSRLLISSKISENFRIFQKFRKLLKIRKNKFEICCKIRKYSV